MMKEIVHESSSAKKVVTRKLQGCLDPEFGYCVPLDVGEN